MKSALVFTLMTAAVSIAQAQQQCAGIFSGDRGGYAERLRNAAQADAEVNQKIQEAVDLRRRILKHLFVDTDLFLRDQATGKWLTVPPKATAGDMNTRLVELIRSITDGGDLQTFRNDDVKMAAFAKARGLSLKQADEVLATLQEATYDKSDEGAAFLAEAFTRSATRLAAARERGLGAGLLTTKIAELRNSRQGNPLGWLQGATVAGGTAVGVGYAFLGIDPWILSSIPVALGGGFVGSHLYNTSPFMTTIKEGYQNMRARSQTKAVAKDMRRLYKETQIVKAAEDADYAFERAWEDWRLNALQAEGSRHKARIERVTDRIAQMSMLLQTTGLWQLPNGERYAEVLKIQGDVLTPERRASLRKGLERKIDQLDILQTEVRWLEHDMQQIRASGGRTGVRANDDAIADTVTQMVATMGSNLSSVRDVIERRQDDLKFMEGIIDSNDRIFRNFLRSMSEKTQAQ